MGLEPLGAGPWPAGTLVLGSGFLAASTPSWWLSTGTQPGSRQSQSPCPRPERFEAPPALSLPVRISLCIIPRSNLEQGPQDAVSQETGPQEQLSHQGPSGDSGQGADRSKCLR